MKKLIALFLLTIIPFIAFSQVTITRTAGTGYFLQTVQGDTLQLRGVTPFYNSYHKAYEDAIDYSLDSGSVVHVRSNIEDRVDAYFFEEEVIIEVDTVFVDRIKTITDTVFVSDPIAENSPIEDELYSNHTMTISSPVNSSGEHTFTSSGWTTADEVNIKYNCNENPITKSAATDNKAIYRDVYTTTCTKDMEITYQYIKDEDTTNVADITPLIFITGEGFENTQEFFTDFENNAVEQWVPLWGNLEFSFADGFLVIDLLQRNIARLQWNQIPTHRNIRYTIRETLHASHSTGAHVGGRHSTSDSNKSSVETFIYTEGLGVSIFNDGSWSNPHTFPFTWESGDTVNYTVEILDDTIRVKVWHEGDPEPTEWEEYTDPLIGEIPQGVFAIGSTGAGLYPIDLVDVKVLD